MKKHVLETRYNVPREEFKRWAMGLLYRANWDGTRMEKYTVCRIAGNMLAHYHYFHRRSYFTLKWHGQGRYEICPGRAPRTRR